MTYVWATELKGQTLHTLFFWSIITFTVFTCSAAATSGATITVPSGGDLQAAINAAQSGDTIVLQAGASYVGAFVLPNKSGTAFITIQSSALASLPGPTERVTPAHAPLMPKMLTPGSNLPALQTSAYAHHYQFVGIEFAPVNASVIVSDLIKLGDGSSVQNSLEMIPHHLILDRCYIHGFPTMELKRGIALNSAETQIKNSYVSEVHGVGYDTQAICGWNGPGPYQIVNNYLEAAGENVMFGGADPYITGLIPSDIVIRKNHFFKPLTWKVGDPSYAGIHWSVKNLFETKNARRVLVDGNIFENCWLDAQVGFGILLKSNNQDGTAPWSVTEDLTFSNNIVRGVDNGLNILAVEVPPKISAVGNRLHIINNFWDVQKIWYQGSNGAVDVVFDHNTFLSREGNTANFYGLVTQGFVFRNNLGVRAGYGFKGDGTAEGTNALDVFCPGWIFEKNVIVGASSTVYPANNFYPVSLNDVGFVDLNQQNYRLSLSSPYQKGGTDGKDIGVDFDALEAALAGLSATPTPTPTPTSTPTPTPVPPSTSVTFVQLDISTKGNWENSYGAEGYNTVNDSVSYPSYAQVSATDYTSPTWMASTTDVRALQKAAASDRVAARWDSTSFLTIDLNLTDGASHQIAIYGLDWDGNNRTQRVDILDWASNALLDSRTISSFNGGQYLVWNIKGHVKITVNKLGGKSAVVSGLYFGSVAATPTPTPTPSPTTTVGKQLGKTKRNGQNLSNQLIPSASSTELTGTSNSFLSQSAYTALVEFVSDIQQTYDLFNGERNLYPAAQRIDTSLKQAFAAGNLATQAADQADLSTVRSRLREAIDKLELTDVLIRYGDVANPIDYASYMVRQQYVDFLDREPDQAGVDFWTNEIASCGSDLQCVEIKRINVSAAFFLSIEFQNTGYYVYRLYKASYGRVPMRQEFVPDRLSIASGVIVGEVGWATKLAANKQAFVQGWVERDDFQARYAGLSNEQYVDTLIANAGIGITSGERDNLVQDLVNGASRADVLAKLVENSTFIRAESNSAFVLMQYFGYLGRDPDSGGFNFWLGKLNQFDGNFVNAEMVKAFLVSTEYRQRFGL